MTLPKAAWPVLRAGVVVFFLVLASDARGLPSRGAHVHRIALPDARRLEAGNWADIDAVAAAPPTPAYPRGTVIVAQATRDEPSPTVTEWDLATGAIIRSAALPLPAVQADMRIARAGDALHVFASRSPTGPIVYARLRPSLETERVERLGFGERPRVATDGSVVAILWSGTQQKAPLEYGWQLVLFDATGHRLWAACLSRTTESTFLYGDPLALVAGHVVTLLPDGPQPSVVEFGADGRSQRVGPAPWKADAWRLFESAGRLLFTDDCTVATLWPRDDPSPVRTPLPNRSERARSCTAFDAVADSRGRLVTSEGEVLSPALALEYDFADPRDAAVLRPLWLFAAPALLVVESDYGHAWLDWADLALAPPANLLPAAGGRRPPIRPPT